MSTRRNPATIALMYAVLAALWIVMSETVLSFAIDDAVLQGRIELLKGLGFVAVTSGLLYLLLRTRVPLPAEDGAPASFGESRRLIPLLYVLALSVPLLGIAVYALHARQDERDAFANLEAEARLKSDQIENWLAERRADSLALAASLGFVERVAKFRATGDAHEESVIGNRLQSLIHFVGYDAVTVFDPAGRQLLTYGEPHRLPETVQALFSTSLTTGEIRMSPLLRDAQGQLHLDFVAPLRLPRAGGHEAIGVIVLHVSPARFLFPTLQAWPSASRSGEFLLARQEGESVAILNNLRHPEDKDLKLHELPGRASLPAAAAVRATQPGTMRGEDYRGVPVLAAWHPIAGTDWRLIAKIDRAEVLQGARATAFWVALVGLFALVVVAASLTGLWRAQRRVDRFAIKAESEQLYRMFFELPFVGMAITSPETKRWVRFNEELCRIFGYSHKELENLSWAEITHQDDLEKDVAEFERVMRGESEGYAMDKRFVRKDGAIIHAAIDVKCQRNPSGKVDLFVATIQDISERKLAESALRESESRLRRAIESAPIPIMIHADDGKVIRISRAWTDITGYELADIPTIDAWTLLAYGEHREMVQKDIARLYDQTSAVREGEYTIRTRSGDTRIWSFMSTSLGSMDDGRRLAISMAMDMTESKQAQGRIETLLGMYATLSRCNEAIVRCENEDDLFAQICAAATEQGGMKLAWVGMADEQGQVRLAASAGAGRAYLDGIVISLAEGDPSGQGPTGTAIRENRPYWCQDFAADPRTAAWHERGARFGWGSSAALPLRRNDVAVGSLTLYSERTGMFDEPMRGLLTDMAADISFSLDNFDREARRKKAEATLLDQYEELRRWYRAMLGREERTLELKHEVNPLLRQSGQAPRYASVDGDSAGGEAPESDKK